MNDVHNLQARCIQPPKSFSTSSCKPMRKDKKKSKKLCNFKKIIYLCTRLTAIRFDSLAQLVEHNTFNVGVLGSNPKRITKRKAKGDNKKTSPTKSIFCGTFFYCSFGDLDRQKEGIDGQKLVPNSYPRQDFQKRGTICRKLAERCRDLATLHLSHYELIKVVL